MGFEKLKGLSALLETYCNERNITIGELCAYLNWFLVESAILNLKEEEFDEVLRYSKESYLNKKSL